MTGKALVLRVVGSVALGTVLALTGVLDATHAALLALLLLAALLLSARMIDDYEPVWPARQSPMRAGGRAVVSDLSWQVFDHSRRVDAAVADRVHRLAVARLAMLGIDATDPAQWPEVERRLGPAIASGLAHDERPTARTLQLWLDAIDRLSDERTTR